MGKVILCDMDGVLTDFVETVECCYLHDFGKRMTGYVGQEMEDRLSTEDERKWFYDLVTSDGFHACMDWCAGANQLVDALYAHGRFVVVTAPMPTGGRDVAAKWIAERMNSIPYASLAGHVVFAGNETKPLIPGDMLIEDRVANLVAWKRYNPQGRAILVHRPWSGCALNDVPQGIEVVTGSYEASLIVKEFSNGQL